jgi:hypothetical protein
MNLPSFRVRAAAFGLLAALGVWLSLLSCSSDPANSLGSDSDVLGSKPGTVYTDTLGAVDDTTYAFDQPIAVGQTIETGYDSVYTRTMVIDVGFTLVNQNPNDTLRTVLSAQLHLPTGALKQVFPVKFYQLGRRYTEGDTLSDFSHLSDADAILDPVKNTIDRNLEAATQLYPVPASLAQSWIRDDSTRTAIAIVYTDLGNQRVAGIPSSENTADHPYLLVNFTDGRSRSYLVANDATVFKPRSSSANLIVSDGYPRRVFLRVPLDSLQKDSAVHTAHTLLHVVPGSFYGTQTDTTEFTMVLYIPDSTDPKAAAFKTGQRITEQFVKRDQKTVDFPMTNAIFLVLQEKLKNNGFAIRCADENTVPRKIEFYGSEAADSLKPRFFITSSTPADFH